MQSMENMECLHHEFCSRSEMFTGCGKRCGNFSYSRSDWLRSQIERIHGVIVPYDYTIRFDPKTTRFIYVPNSELTIFGSGV